MTMNQDAPTLVGLFGRGAEIGYAVLDGHELVRFGVVTIRGKRRGAVFVERVQRQLTPLLAYGGCLVVEKHPAPDRLGGLYRTLDRLADRWKKEGKRVLRPKLASAKRLLICDATVPNRLLIRSVEERYPLLRLPDGRVRASQMKYRAKAVLALGLTLAALRELGSD